MKLLSIFLLVVLVGCGTLSAQTVGLFWGDTLFVAPNETVSLDLKVRGFQSIGAFGFQLDWDATALTLVSVEDVALTTNYNAALTPMPVAWINLVGTGTTLPDSTTILRLTFLAANTATPTVAQVRFHNVPSSTEFYRLNGQLLQPVPVTTDTGHVVIRTCNLAFDFPNDTAFCTGDSVFIAPQCAACTGTPIWSDGTAAAGRWVNAAGWQVVEGQGQWRCTVADSVWITENPLPTLVVPPDALLCEGESAIIGPVATDPAYSYSWSNGPTTAGQVVDTPGTYYLTASTAAGCSSQGSVAVRLVSQLHGSVAASADTVCAGASVTLQADFPNAQWIDTSGWLTIEPNGDARLQPLATTTVWVFHENECFAEQLAYTVHVRQPQLTVSQDTTIQAGGQATLRAAGAVDYQWSGPGIVGNGQQSEISVRPDAPSQYVVQAQDEQGCTATAAVRVGVRPIAKVYAPNAFSPNQDGTNDRFTLFGDAVVEVILSLSIFDRWGQLLFEQHDFPPNAPAYGWDGRVKGEMQTQGTFVYKAAVRFSDGSMTTLAGELLLIR